MYKKRDVLNENGNFLTMVHYRTNELIIITLAFITMINLCTNNM